MQNNPSRVNISTQGLSNSIDVTRLLVMTLEDNGLNDRAADAIGIAFDGMTSYICQKIDISNKDLSSKIAKLDTRVGSIEENVKEIEVVLHGDGKEAKGICSRLDHLEKTVATKTDLANESNSLIKWMMGGWITLMIAIIGGFFFHS